MTRNKPVPRPQPQEPERHREDPRHTDTKAPARKPEDEDMPGADGFRSARADEDTYD